MNAIYQAIGISKQSFHQQMNLGMKQMEERQQLRPLIAQIRSNHPRMSAREIYQLMHPEHIGRDRFIAFCFENGYKLERKNDYLIHYGPKDFHQLKQMTQKAVDRYNLYRPHKSLNGVAPGAFEELLTKRTLNRESAT